MENQPKQKFGKYTWLIFGLSWGVFMFVFMGIVVRLLNKKELDFQWILISITVSLITGLVLGYVYQWRADKQRKNDKN